MILFSNEHLTVFQSALFQINSAVLAFDDFVLVVDPACLPHEIREIQSHVASIRGNKDLYVLFTHGDFDHIIGFNAFPDAKTIGSWEMLHHPKKEHKLKLIREFDATYYLTRDYEIEFPRLDLVIEKDAEQLTIGTTTLTFYKAPGHTADSLYTVIDSLGVFLTGDYLSDFELPFIYHSAVDYEQTIRKAQQILDNHPVQILIPGHGQTTDSRTDMTGRIATAFDYLDRLKQAVLSDDEATIRQLEGEFQFYSPMTVECHQENVNIIRREYRQGLD
ncbi:hydrolase glyoxylase [Tumebacillus avium]|uniref:Hydrolase glyoxylase n=1 Tax=Tumebacillus avium TaxID=1903704 RepID=A0A1Y0II67_9BACL|nr:MBL fold metallo-hydrolase [Tumebacillus avium]ARU60147.1 hydrolase glyoxylase [Tumebacillus avium]